MDFYDISFFSGKKEAGPVASLSIDRSTPAYPFTVKIHNGDDFGGVFFHFADERQWIAFKNSVISEGEKIRAGRAS